MFEIVFDEILSAINTVKSKLSSTLTTSLLSSVKHAKLAFVTAIEFLLVTEGKSKLSLK